MIEERESETAKKLDSVAAEHIALKARADTTFGAMRWIAVSAFGVLVTVILTGFTIAVPRATLKPLFTSNRKRLISNRKRLINNRRRLMKLNTRLRKSVSSKSNSVFPTD